MSYLIGAPVWAYMSNAIWCPVCPLMMNGTENGSRPETEETEFERAENLCRRRSATTRRREGTIVPKVYWRVSYPHAGSPNGTTDLVRPLSSRAGEPLPHCHVDVSTVECSSALVRDGAPLITRAVVSLTLLHVEFWPLPVSRGRPTACASNDWTRPYRVWYDSAGPRGSR